MTAEPPAIWTSGPWTEKYEFVSILGDGGQGYTFEAIRKSDQTTVALKRLRPDRDTPKSRRRMFREVTALRTLSKTDALVPKFIESNIESAIENDRISPFVVMEFISGQTLLKVQEVNGPMDLHDAIEFTLLLIKTIEIAHSEDTAHRDIKPRNIVMLESDISQPYIIDFGLSFNRVKDHEDGLTSIRESIGNSFLTLHETESTGSESKHDFKSDLTLAIGIFFYLLTNKFPEFLSADSSRSPHRRHKALIDSDGSSVASHLMTFFDRAFQYDVKNRFDTPAEIRSRFEQLKQRAEGELPDIDLLAVTKQIKKRLNNENRDYQLDGLEDKHKSVLTKFRKHLQALQQNPELKPVSLNFQIQQFRNRQFNSVEVVRKSLTSIQLGVRHYIPRAVCRYFLTISGIEITLAFQEFFESDNTKLRQLEQNCANAVTSPVLHFVEWGDSHEEHLKRHFANWFEQTTEKIIGNLDDTHSC